MQYGLFRAVDRGVVLDKCKLLNSCKHFYAHRTTASINNYNEPLTTTQRTPALTPMSDPSILLHVGPISLHCPDSATRDGTNPPMPCNAAFLWALVYY